MTHDTKDPQRTGTAEEGHPIPGAEAMGFSEAPDEVEPVTGHLDESVSRPSHDHLNRTVSKEALDAARSHPLFAPDERPITGHLDEAAPAKPAKDAKP